MSDDPGVRVLRAEAAVWRESVGVGEPADAGESMERYDRAVADLIDGQSAATGDASGAQRRALLELAQTVLERPAAELVEVPAAVVRSLITVLPSLDAADLRRAAALVIAAWRRLVTVAGKGPTSIDTAPELPPGVLLPAGADPAQITDPGQRAEADQLAARHRDEVRRWSARQRALGSLQHAAALAAAVDTIEPGRFGELWLTLRDVSGVPDHVRSSLPGTSG